MQSAMVPPIKGNAHSAEKTTPPVKSTVSTDINAVSVFASAVCGLLINTTTAINALSPFVSNQLADVTSPLILPRSKSAKTAILKVFQQIQNLRNNNCIPINRVFAKCPEKTRSRILEKASLRLDGIQSINPNLNVGEGFSAEGYSQIIDKLRADISAYNTVLSTVDSLQNVIDDTEKMLAEYSERMLIGVALHHYGKDSNEYERAGGVRKRDSLGRQSHRKRPARKVAAV
jgi:hypothetical protein